MAQEGKMQVRIREVDWQKVKEWDQKYWFSLENSASSR
jgi:hypothetical protein